MEPININNEEYISTDYLFGKAPVYCNKCRNGRELIRKKQINDYIFVKLVDKEWIITDGKSYKRDQVFFKKSFVDTIPEFNQEAIITDDNNVELAPDIIHLENSEKFKDNENNIIEIETRGERNVDKIYFKVKDVMEGFGMENIITTIIDKRSYGYLENIHYKYFNCRKIGKTQKNSNKIKKELYLTYEGMLRVLFASHSQKVKPFIKWATETLFTHQLGTKEEKKQLANKLLGCDIDESRKILKTSSCKISSIYLLTLGYVKDLRNSFQIPESFADNYILVKYGRTDNLERRLKEHQNKFNKIDNVNVLLKLYSYVDSDLASKAENDVKLLFQLNKNILVHPEYNELAVINPDDFDKWKQAYDIIRNNYGGSEVEYIYRIMSIEDKCEIKLLKKENEILEYKLKIMELEMKLSKLNIICDHHQL
jgi:predicted GIY-YIG superfamily endonuclease